MRTDHPQDEAAMPEGEAGLISPRGEMRLSPAPASPMDAAVLSAVFQRAGAGLCLVGPDNRVVAANPLWFEVAGLAEIEVAGRLIHEVLSMPRETAFSLYARVRAGQTVQMPRHSHLVQGVERWWDGSVSPVPMAGGTGILITVRDISDQVAHERRQEELLLEVQRRASELDAVIESIGDGVVIVDLAGRILRINPAGLAALSGDSRDPVPTTLDAFAVLRPAFLDGTPMPIESWPIHRLLRGERVADQERLVTTPSGESRRVMISASPVRGENGEIILGVVVFRDITAVREQERSLKHTEDRFRLIALNSQDIIYSYRIKPEPRFEYVSPAMTAITGYTPEEFYADPSLANRMVLTEDLPILEAALQSPSNSHDPIVVRWVRRDGRVIWTEQRNTMILDEAGEAIMVHGVVRDISERKEVETERERLLAQMDATIESIADGIIVYAPDGSLSFMNEGGRRILGHSPEERTGPIQDWARRMEVRTVRGDLIPPQETPTARALQGETVRGVTMSIQRPDGSVVWVSSSAAPIRTSSGAVLGTVVTFTDITRIQELQDQREDFIRTISHDLRNPLTPIMGQSGILSRLLGAEGREREARAADMILTNAHRMNSMIEDLVESVRLDSGQIPLRRRSVDLCHLISDLSERVGSQEDRGRLQVDYPSQPCLVEVDPERLERVMTNLLTNAFKYSAPGSPVWLKVQSGDREAGIAVSDQGPGIASEDLPHIFQRYYRSRVRQSGEGLGLGLYIARLLVEAHGGRISVESSVGVGSTFRVLFPLSSP